eukprot:g12825.t1
MFALLPWCRDVVVFAESATSSAKQRCAACVFACLFLCLGCATLPQRGGNGFLEAVCLRYDSVGRAAGSGSSSRSSTTTLTGLHLAMAVAAIGFCVPLAVDAGARAETIPLSVLSPFARLYCYAGAGVSFLMLGDSDSPLPAVALSRADAVCVEAQGFLGIARQRHHGTERACDQALREVAHLAREAVRWQQLLREALNPADGLRERRVAMLRAIGTKKDPAPSVKRTLVNALALTSAFGGNRISTGGRQLHLQPWARVQRLMAKSAGPEHLFDNVLVESTAREEEAVAQMLKTSCLDVPDGEDEQQEQDHRDHDEENCSGGKMLKRSELDFSWLQRWAEAVVCLRDLVRRRLPTARDVLGALEAEEKVRAQAVAAAEAACVAAEEARTRVLGKLGALARQESEAKEAARVACRIDRLMTLRTEDDERANCLRWTSSEPGEGVVDFARKPCELSVGTPAASSSQNKSSSKTKDSGRGAPVIMSSYAVGASTRKSNFLEKLREAQKKNEAENRRRAEARAYGGSGGGEAADDDVMSQREQTKTKIFLDSETSIIGLSFFASREVDNHNGHDVHPLQNRRLSGTPSFACLRVFRQFFPSLYFEPEDHTTSSDRPVAMLALMVLQELAAQELQLLRERVDVEESAGELSCGRPAAGVEPEHEQPSSKKKIRHYTVMVEGHADEGIESEELQTHLSWERSLFVASFLRPIVEKIKAAHSCRGGATDDRVEFVELKRLAEESGDLLKLLRGREMMLMEKGGDGRGGQREKQNYENEMVAKRKTSYAKNAPQLLNNGTETQMQIPIPIRDARSTSAVQCGVAGTIEFYSNKGHEQDAAAFLDVAKNAVQQTEPGTKLWYGVKFHAMDVLGQKEEADRFGIIDFFVDDAAKDAHFAGEVPKAVKANDATESPIVKGGLGAIVESAKAWDLLFAPKTTSKEQMEAAKFVGYLPILAGEGQEENMKALLKAGLGLVTEKEAKTSFWAAVQNQANKREFAIIDTFDSMEGVAEHFVAPAAVPTAVQGVLAENPDLIVGGWEEGVLKNVRIMEIVAKKVELA